MRVIFVPVAVWLVSWQGWRTTLLTLAIILLAVCFPIHALGLRERSTTTEGQTESRVGKASTAALRRALLHPSFWALLVTFTGATACTAADRDSALSNACSVRDSKWARDHPPGNGNSRPNWVRRLRLDQWNDYSCRTHWRGTGANCGRARMGQIRKLRAGCLGIVRAGRHRSRKLWRRPLCCRRGKTLSLETTAIMIAVDFTKSELAAEQKFRAACRGVARRIVARGAETPQS